MLDEFMLCASHAAAREKYMRSNSIRAEEIRKELEQNTVAAKNLEATVNKELALHLTVSVDKSPTVQQVSSQSTRVLGLGSNYHEQGTHSREEIIATNEVVPSVEASPVTSLSLNFANLSEVTGTIEPNVVTEECNQLLPSANPSPRIGLNQEQNSVG